MVGYSSKLIMIFFLFFASFCFSKEYTTLDFGAVKDGVYAGHFNDLYIDNIYFKTIEKDARLLIIFDDVIDSKIKNAFANRKRILEHSINLKK